MGNCRPSGVRRLSRGGVVRHIFVASICLLGAIVAAQKVRAVESPDNRSSLRLVMIEEMGCNYCIRWHREVGPGYPLSEEGRRAPLIQIDRFSAEAKRFQRVTFSPTFILLSQDTEIGRITGYPGADFFWSMLSELVAKAGSPGALVQRDTAVR